MWKWWNFGCHHLLIWCYSYHSTIFSEISFGGKYGQLFLKTFNLLEVYSFSVWLIWLYEPTCEDQGARKYSWAGFGLSLSHSFPFVVSNVMKNVKFRSLLWGGCAIICMCVHKPVFSYDKYLCMNLSKFLIVSLWWIVKLVSKVTHIKGLFVSFQHLLFGLCSTSLLHLLAMAHHPSSSFSNHVIPK